MFKRVDKKRKKREEEEELGLDEDMKEIMGLNDTDSEESASESDSDSDVEQSDKGGLEESGEETGDDVEDVDASEDDEPPISLSEALRDPVYVVSLDPDVRACLLCKGKVIKGTPMSQVHKTSTAHKRRFERFKSLSAEFDRDTDAWQIARTIRKESSTQNPPDTESSLSKRALKRTAKQASIREKRMLHNKLRAKAKAKAKQAAKGVSESQDAGVKVSLATDPLLEKPRKVGATKKGQRKAPGDKLHDVKQSDVSPQKKKQKVQKDHTETSASPRTPLRSQEKPLGKRKAPREKRTNKS